MSVTLRKGQKITLSKDKLNLKTLLVGLGWRMKEGVDEDSADLDASVFCVGENGKCQTDQDFIFYFNTDHPTEAIHHCGDNKVGGDGVADDEQIMIDLTKVPDRIKKLIFTVTIYDDGKSGTAQIFGQVKDAFIRIVDTRTDKELCRFDLTNEYISETALIVAQINRDDDKWSFEAIGEGFEGGLAGLCERYGIEVE